MKQSTALTKPDYIDVTCHEKDNKVEGDRIELHFNGTKYVFTNILIKAMSVAMQQPYHHLMREDGRELIYAGLKKLT